MASPTLSLAIIARDEADNLPGLFASLQFLHYSQIVFVDTGSQDATVSMAKNFGAELYEIPWKDDFSEARNFGIHHCRGDFILWLDADDRISEAMGKGIPALLQNGKQAWRLVVRSVRENGAGDVFRQIRIFPNEMGIFFEGRIHEQLGLACRKQGLTIMDSDLEIQHTGYVSTGLRKEKAQRNLRILRHEFEAYPHDSTVVMALCNALCQTEDTNRIYEAKDLLNSRVDHLPVSVIPTDPILRRFPCLLSECCQRLGRKEEAEGWDTIAQEWEPNHLLPFFRQAKRALEYGNLALAFNLFLKISLIPPEIGLLPADNASVRRNALGFVAILDVKQHGLAQAFQAKEAILTLMSEGLEPLPLDPLFPWEFFLQRNEDALAFAYADAYLTIHPDEKSLASARNLKGVVSPTPETNLPEVSTRGRTLSHRFGTIRSPLQILHPHGLSIVMIVKNEVKNMRAAVESFRTIADEIVVNDTGSTDGTQKLLSELGLHWFQTEWQNDFSLARNQSLAQAKYSWILWLDADDRIPADQLEFFRKLKTAPLDRAFGFQVINTQGGLPLGGRFMQIRMFPNHPKIRFRYKIHEQIVHSIAELGLYCFHTETTIHHVGYEDAALKRTKAQRNLDLLSGETKRLLEEPSLAMSVGDSYFILGEWEKGINAYKTAFEIPGCKEMNGDVYAELPACIGRGYQKLKQYSEALQWLARSREVDPRKLESAYYEAECFLEMGKKVEAEAAFTRVAEMPLFHSATSTQYDTIRIFSFWHKAQLEAERGVTVRAIATLEHLNQIYPNVLEAWHLLGKLKQQEGAFDQALQSFQKGIDLNPNVLPELHRDLLG